MLAEGLDIFRITVPPLLEGQCLSETQIREKTGCNVIAIRSDDIMKINPDPSIRLSKNDELIIIGTDEAEKLFMKTFSA